MGNSNIEEKLRNMIEPPTHQDFCIECGADIPKLLALLKSELESIELPEIPTRESLHKMFKDEMISERRYYYELGYIDSNAQCRAAIAKRIGKLG